VSRSVLENECSLALVRNGQSEAVALGDEAVFSMRIAHAPNTEAPLVFVGYGLTVPEANHDDLAGVGFRGQVVLFFDGRAARNFWPPQSALPVASLGGVEARGRHRRHFDSKPARTGHPVGAFQTGALSTDDGAG